MLRNGRARRARRAGGGRPHCRAPGACRAWRDGAGGRRNRRTAGGLLRASPAFVPFVAVRRHIRNGDFDGKACAEQAAERWA